MSNVVALEVQLPKKSITNTMAAKYGMEAPQFEATLMATVAKGCTKEQFAAFLVVANEYNLNPLTKEIYAFPANGGIQPIVSVDGWINLANSHPQLDGIILEEGFDEKGSIVSVKATIHRKDRKYPTVITEYTKECVRNTAQWKEKPIRMLRHKALIQCARVAFGFAGIYDEDEADRIVANNKHSMVDVTPAPPPPPPANASAAPPPQSEKAKPIFNMAEYRDKLEGCSSELEASSVLNANIDKLDGDVKTIEIITKMFNNLMEVGNVDG